MKYKYSRKNILEVVKAASWHSLEIRAFDNRNTLGWSVGLEDLKKILLEKLMVKKKKKSKWLKKEKLSQDIMKEALCGEDLTKLGKMLKHGTKKLPTKSD